MSGPSTQYPSRAGSSSAAPRSIGDEADEAVAVLTNAFRRLYPDATSPEELSSRDKATWFRVRDTILEGHRALGTLSDSLSETIVKQCDAELEEGRETRRGREARDEILLAVELNERETQRRDTSTDRRFFRWLTGLSAMAAFALTALGVALGQPLIFVGSGVGVLATGGGFFQLDRLALLGKAHLDEARMQREEAVS